MAYLLTMALNLPGNLAFGDVSLQMDLDLRDLSPTPAEDKLDCYVGMHGASTLWRPREFVAPLLPR
ncbi:MAG: hypothetical protein ACK4S6_00480 [Roseateles asaccharophilus]|uniref:hypothetical protein n=1 Tax=Roseateles asaccharophilus TaxID=582607 RepID=UPI003919F7BF